MSLNLPAIVLFTGKFLLKNERSQSLHKLGKFEANVVASQGPVEHKWSPVTLFHVRYIKGPVTENINYQKVGPHPPVQKTALHFKPEALLCSPNPQTKVTSHYPPWLALSTPRYKTSHSDGLNPFSSVFSGMRNHYLDKSLNSNENQARGD